VSLRNCPPLYRRTSSRQISKTNARRVIERIMKELETLRERSPKFDHYHTDVARKYLEKQMNLIGENTNGY
jgi:hypothetical protein